MKVQGGRFIPQGRKGDPEAARTYKEVLAALKGKGGDFARAYTLLNSSSDPSLKAIAQDVRQLDKQYEALLTRLLLLDSGGKYR